MKFGFSSQRMLEIFPGLLVWITLLSPLLLSFFWPEAVMVFLILYTVLWLIRSLEFSYFLIKTHWMSRFFLQLDWCRMLNYFTPQSTLSADLAHETGSVKKKFLLATQARIEKLKETGELVAPDQIYHIVVMATYKEEIDVLRGSLRSLAGAAYDLKKIYFILAGEQRDAQRAQDNAAILQQEFGSQFAGFYSTIHPSDIPGETPGKGSNISYAAKKIVPEILATSHIDPARMLVTSLDADNCVHRLYFANLTFHYLLSEKREQKSYQPLPLFYNNIWDVPIFNRIVAFSSSFWHMIESGRPDRLRNFSSHAQPLSALLKTDFWSCQTIVEDGHQYWRSYFAFQGDYSVTPLFIPIYQDAVQSKGYTKTLWSQYKQLRRWAWGCSDIPYVVRKMKEHKKDIPFSNRFYQLFRLIEGHYMWATAPIVVTLTGPVPRMINAAFGKTVMSYNMGLILGYFFSIAMVGIVVSIWTSLLMSPPYNASSSIPRWWARISTVLQWFLLPFTTIIFGALPAIEAQTRLMLGKYLDFNVTEKVRSCKVQAPSPS